MVDEETPGDRLLDAEPSGVGDPLADDLDDALSPTGPAASAECGENRRSVICERWWPTTRASGEASLPTSELCWWRSGSLSPPTSPTTPR